MLNEFLSGLRNFVGYYLIAVALMLIIRAFLKPPQELFRKMLHVVCALSVLVLIYSFDTWYLAMLTPILFAMVVYPAISYFEKFPKVMEILTQRKKGEVKSSLILVFLMMALLITIFWGWLGKEWKYIVITSVMAWGFGDAAAALIGKSFGHNPIHHRLVEETKTKEGTAAMFFVSALTIFFCLMIYTSLTWYICMIVALLAAPICAVIELLSHNGVDTITVPLASAISVFSLMVLISNKGV